MPQGSPEEVERNREIWLRHCNGETEKELAAAYGVSQPRIHQIVSRHKRQLGLDADTREDLVRDLVAEIQRNREVLAEIRDEDAPPAFDVRGMILRNDKGEVVKNRSDKFTASKELINQQAHLSKLLGLNAPDRSIVDQNVKFEVSSAEDV